MKLTTLDEDLRVHQKLDDEPNDVGGLSAQELKERFDHAGVAIQKYLNETHLPEEEAAAAETLAAAKAYTDQKVVILGTGDMAAAVYDTKKRCSDVYEYAEAKAREAKADTSKLGYVTCAHPNLTASASIESAVNNETMTWVDPKGIWNQDGTKLIAPPGAKAVTVNTRVRWARETYGEGFIRILVNGEEREVVTGPTYNNGTYVYETVLLMAEVEEGDEVVLEIEARKGSGTQRNHAEIILRDVLVEFLM